MYVDILPHDGMLNSVLERNATVLVGQRGTGKSTVFAMAQKKIAQNKKDLSVYINAKNIYKSCEIDRTSFASESTSVFSEQELFRISFIKRAMAELCDSLVSELKSEKNFLTKITNYLRDKQIDELIDEINTLLSTEDYQIIDKILSKSEKIANEDEITGKLKASLTNAEAAVACNTKYGKEENVSHTLARVLNVSGLIKNFLETIGICKRSGIYIFIDDYSELSYIERNLFMNELIVPFYHLGVDKVFLKIACYPNKVEPLNFDSQKFVIQSIDYYDVYGVDNSITKTEEKAEEYVQRLMENACDVCCGCSLDEYFDISNNNMSDYFKVLQRISMNVPRVLGHILNTCFYKRIVSDKKINPSVLQEAAIKYYREHVEVELKNNMLSKNLDCDSKVNSLVQKKIIEAIIELAQNNKTNLSQTGNTYFSSAKENPTSHFRVNADYDIYLEELSFYGFVQKTNEIADKGKIVNNRIINTSIYALNYGLCLIEKILYGKPDAVDTKYYQQRAFLYDDVILTVLKENKKNSM